MLDFDSTGYAPETLDESAQVDAGWHLATLTLWHTEKKTGKLKFTWRIDSPPWNGAVLVDTLTPPALAMTTEEMPGLVRRMGLFLYRVGAIKKEDMGQRLSVDLDKIVGVQRVLEIKREASKDTSKGVRMFSNIAYGAYWSLDRPEIPVAERVRLGLSLLPGQVAPVPGASATAPVPHNGQQGNTASLAAPAAAAFDPSEVV